MADRGDDGHRQQVPESMSLVERAAKELERRSQGDSTQDQREEPKRKRHFARSREPYKAAAAANQAPVTPIDRERLKAFGGLDPNRMQSRLAEELRLIKAGLIRRMYRGEHGHSNVVQVTSAWPSEGKSFLSVNLALSLASEIDLHVVLVDLDIHRSAIRDALGIETEAGLLDVVQNPDLDLSEVIVRTDIPRLSVIGTGKMRTLSTELLASQRMRDVTAELSQRYSDRVIIFDTPPLLGTSEPGVLAQLAGQIIFVIEADRTTRRAIDQAIEQLPADDRTSIVLNKSRGLVGGTSLPYYGYYQG